MSGNKSFQERVSIKDVGEQLFEKYCAEKQYKLARLGFNPNEYQIKDFYKLNPLLRNIPDYVVETPNNTFVVQVKGTANIKKKEIDLIPLFMEWYSSKEAPLVYAFCFIERKPRLIYADQVIELYKNSVDKVWHDGVVYRSLEI